MRLDHTASSSTTELGWTSVTTVLGRAVTAPPLTDTVSASVQVVLGRQRALTTGQRGYRSAGLALAGTG